MSFPFILAFCYIWTASAIPNPGALAERAVTYTLKPPSSAPATAQTVDANYVSLSFEFPDWPLYTGNKTHPNRFSARLIQNLKDISGEYPILRPGGEPQDMVRWDPNLPVEQVAPYDHPSAEVPINVTIGPKFMDTFFTFPSGVKYIFGLSFPSDTLGGLANTVAEAKSAIQSLGTKLYALEPGNEPEYWHHLETKPEDYNVTTYIKEWLECTDAISKFVPKKWEPFFQAGDFQGPTNIDNITTFNVKNAILLGMTKTGKVKTLSDHQYMGASASSGMNALLNRTVMTSQMVKHQILGDYVTARGYKYVLGETNSLSGHGKEGVSNAFGAALWGADYALYNAALNTSRMYYHQGAVFRYSSWQVDKNATFHRNVLPLYYGNLFTATAFAGGNVQVVPVINETYFAAYALYKSSKGSYFSKPKSTLKHIAVFNKRAYNATQGTRPYASFKLPGSIKNAAIRRLTAPGVFEKTGVTFAGQSVDVSSGKILGTKKVERPRNGEVLVGDSEGVLISV